MNSFEHVFDSPVEVVKKTSIVSFSINDIVVHLFSHCRVFVSLFDESHTIVDNRVLNMSNLEYLKWGADDTYIIDWVKQQIDTTSVVGEP